MLTLEGWHITDHYLPETRMRLRRLTSEKGNIAFYKFTQKYRENNQEAASTSITNLYLRAAEYLRLRKLGGNRLEKIRYTHHYEGHFYSVDVFLGPLEGLILAEIEFENEESINTINQPAFAVAEVTQDPFFEGANLAKVGKQELQDKLSGYK